MDLVINTEVMVDLSYPAGATAGEAEEIRKNLICLYNTPVGSCGLNRDFGIDWSFLDMPTETAKAMFGQEVMRKTEQYEPRARVTDMIWSEDAGTGKLNGTVVITLV